MPLSPLHLIWGCTVPPFPLCLDCDRSMPPSPQGCGWGWATPPPAPPPARSLSLPLQGQIGAGLPPLFPFTCLDGARHTRLCCQIGAISWIWPVDGLGTAHLACWTRRLSTPVLVHDHLKMSPFLVYNQVLSNFNCVKCH